MPDAVSDLVRTVRDRLAAAGNPAKAPAMQAYMKSTMPFRGVSADPLRRICRQVYDAHRLPDRESWEVAVRTLWDGATYREERYAANALTQSRHYRAHQDPSVVPLYRHLVVTGAWWDHVDPVATRSMGGLLASHPDATGRVLRSWAVEDDLWLRRTAVLAQLHRREATDLALLTHAIDANLPGSRHGDDFFVRKAVGWALRQHARLDPDWVRSFAADRPLSALSRREALKHVQRLG